ncbi:Protein transport protein S9 plasma membrane t-SNARE [Cytospora paraplurivora]|uniref:Protein transport protein S9 plasma membrane t-SNARE n=1 Tax=Cytospora paraplurivora TaxID=2898453 RepID=A0AAN9YEY2_9PEZI
MPASTKSVPTAVDAWPLPSTEDDQINKVGPAAGQKLGRRRGAMDSRTALSEKTVDRQDTSDSDHDPIAGKEKELEVQPKPQPTRGEPVRDPPPAAAPSTTTVPTIRDTDNEKKRNKTKEKKKNQDTNANDANAHDISDSCLPFRHRGACHGPRKSDKGDKGGHIGLFQKLKMGLFSRKKNKSPEQANPYAAPITPYQQARAQLAQGPGPGPVDSGFSNSHVGSFPPSNPPPPYNQSPSVASSSSRFGDEKYGNQKGYGSTPYDNNNASAFKANGRGPGGYGGLEEDAGKNDLFGNAAGRYAGQQDSANGPSSSKPSLNGFDKDPAKAALLGHAQDRYNQPSQPGAAADEFDGYGAPRALTEEEQEELEVQAMKDETSALRKEGVASTNRTLAMSKQAIETARGTLARLGAQGDRLHHTETNLDAAAAKSRIAEDRTRELKTLNGSMFAVHVGNPFTAKRRQQEADDAVLERHRMERETRQATRKDAYAAQQGLEQTFMEFERKKRTKNIGSNRAERSKFIFDDDDGEAEADEDAIDENTEEIADDVSDLKVLATRMGEEISSQNKLIDRIADKSDLVDDHVRMNREKLSRIR